MLSTNLRLDKCRISLQAASSEGCNRCWCFLTLIKVPSKVGHGIGYTLGPLLIWLVLVSIGRIIWRPNNPLLSLLISTKRGIEIVREIESESWSKSCETKNETSSPLVKNLFCQTKREIEQLILRTDGHAALIFSSPLKISTFNFSGNNPQIIC